jgi:hypothetical protein
MKILRCAEAFDGRDVVALLHYRQREARGDPAPVDDHGAGAALALVASLLRARKSQPFMQRVQERGARIEHHVVLGAVDAQQDVGAGGRCRLCCLRNGLSLGLRQERSCGNGAARSRGRLE